jgi:acyl-coenzyme A thioesterase PaaI-like protein
MNSIVTGGAERMAKWQAPYPEFRVHAQESFKRQGFVHTRGVELAEIEAGYCELRVPYQEKLVQQREYFLGGKEKN